MTDAQARADFTAVQRRLAEILGEEERVPARPHARFTPYNQPASGEGNPLDRPQWLEQARPHVFAHTRRRSIRHALDHAELWDLLDREEALLAETGERWVEPIRPWLRGWTFRGGHLAHVEMSADDLLRHGAELFRIAPVRELTLPDVTHGALAELLAAGLLDGVTHLTLPGDGVNVLGCRLLAQSDRLGALRFLNLTVLEENNSEPIGVGDAGAEELARATGLTGLEHLELNANCIGAAGVKALAEAPLLAQLTTLDLSNNWRGGQEGLKTLAASTQTRRLRRLYLSRFQPSQEGVVALAASPVLATVEHLDLWGSGAGDVGVAALAASPHVGRLRSLNLGYCQLGDDGAAALAASPNLGELIELALPANDVGDQGLVALLGSAHLSKLTTLWASTGRLGDKPAWPAQVAMPLRHLSLAQGNLGPTALKRLLEQDWIAGLRYLDLGTSALTPKGVQALAQAESVRGLVALDVTHCQAGSAGAKALAASPHLGALCALHLEDPQVEDAGTVALRESLAPRLRVLDLGGNPHTVDVAEVLPPRPRLHGTSEPELLAAVIADPDNDEPRLAYADWLDAQRGEAARAYATCIRAQCAVARLPPGDPRVAGLNAQAGAAWEPARAHLSALLPGCRCWDVRRGMIEHVQTDGKTFIQNVAVWARNTPLRSASLDEMHLVSMEKFAALPELLRFTRLMVRGKLDNAHALILARSPNLAGLGELHHGDRIGDVGVRALANSPHLANLHTLKLNGNRIGPAGATALANSTALVNLRHLFLGFNKIGDEGIAAIAAAPLMRNLVELHASVVGMTDEGAGALAESDNLPALAVLHLEGNDLSLEGLRLLQESPKLRSLARVYRRDNPLKPAPRRKARPAPAPAGADPRQLLAVALGDSVSGLALLADGRAACALGDAGVCVWEPKTGAVLRTWPTETLAMSVAAHGANVAAGLSTGEVVVWDADTGTRRSRRDTRGNAVEALAYSPDGATLAWGPPPRKRQRDAEPQAPEELVQAVSFTADGRHIVTAHDGGAVRVWPAGGGEANTFYHHPDPQDRGHEERDDRASAALVTRDGRQLITGGHDGTVRFWLLARRAERLRLQVGRVTALALSPDEKVLAVGDQRGLITLCNEDAQPLLTLGRHVGGVTAVAFSADGRRLISTGEDGSARVWDVTDLPPLSGGMPSRAVHVGSYGTSLTEAEWVAARRGEGECPPPYSNPLDRKLLLYKCACARQLGLTQAEHLTDEVLDRAERLAYRADLAELMRRWNRSDVGPDEAALGALFTLYLPLESDAGLREQACVIENEVLGNPFRPPRVDPPWLSANDGAAGRLLHEIHEERRYKDLPRLANLLEQAGCIDGELLAHLRTGGPHFVGCWAVDALLGIPPVSLLPPPPLLPAEEEAAFQAEKEAILGAVFAEPERDEPRLAYAGWFDRAGEAQHGEFIRWQIELARVPLRSPRWHELHELIDARLKTHGRDSAGKGKREQNEVLWRGELPDYAWMATFRRGFIEQVTFVDEQDVFKFFEDPEALLGAAPIRSLVFEGHEMRKFEKSRLARLLPERVASLPLLMFRGLDDGVVEELLANPASALLRGLALSSPRITDRTATALARATHLTALKTLWFPAGGRKGWATKLSPTGVAALARAEHLSGLEDLLLSRNNVGDDGAKALAEAPVLARLGTLRLIDAGLSNAGVISLANSPHLRGLTRLEVSVNFSMLTPGGGRGETSDVALLALAESEHLANLRELHVAYNGADETSLLRLASRPGLQHLALQTKMPAAKMRKLQERLRTADGATVTLLPPDVAGAAEGD